jgi:uncharacterized protein YecE (DUF72 family)
MTQIRAGIGGWDFAPWRDNFYPKGLPHTQELRFASLHVTTIEINATFYRTQKPDSFRRWAQETPDEFVFSLKAHRLTTHRKTLSEAAPSIEHFLASGLLELGSKLGPVLWQFAPTKKFDPEDFETFLAALPHEAEGIKLRHAVEVRHASFCNPAFVALTRHYDVAICLSDSEKYPMIADASGDLIYARLQKSVAGQANGYAAKDIAAWCERAKLWAQGKQPQDLPYFAGQEINSKSRDCFIYFISGAKERNPAAAMALIEQLDHAGLAGSG